MRAPLPISSHRRCCLPPAGRLRAATRLSCLRRARQQIQGLPTMIFIGTNDAKPALRTEGLLPAETIKNIIAKEL